MIFDRIDIFVVCIVFGCCITVAEVFIEVAWILRLIRLIPCVFQPANFQ